MDQMHQCLQADHLVPVNQGCQPDLSDLMHQWHLLVPKSQYRQVSLGGQSDQENRLLRMIQNLPLHLVNLVGLGNLLLRKFNMA